jgi:hypothetical protein
MTPEQFRRVDQLVSLALERPASERAEFIRKACVGEEDLRLEVESLLATQDKEDGFLAEAPARLAALLAELTGPPEMAAAASAIPAATVVPSPRVSEALSAARVRPKRRNYFIRHWRGELPLWMSFWVNAILIGNAALVAGNYVIPVLTRSVAFFLTSTALVTGLSASVVGSAGLFLTWPWIILVLTWSLVGAWRSTASHLARVGIVLYIACLGILLGNATVMTLKWWLSQSPKVCASDTPKSVVFGLGA